MTNFKPSVCYDVEKNEWYLDEDFEYKDHGFDLILYKGFRSDLASIPRFFWREIAPYELSILAPLVHDLLYRSGGRYITSVGIEIFVSRKEVDNLFLEIMKDEGVSRWRRTAAYHAVRMFAAGCWKGGK